MVADHDVVEDRQWQRQARALEGARDAAEIDGARTGVGDVGAGEGYLSLVGGVDAGDHVEQGRLARTVGTDEAENFVLRDRDIEAVERDDAAETFHQPAGLEQHRHGRHPGK